MIESFSSDKQGYCPLFKSGDNWMLAFFNSNEDERTERFQRHFETDECFVLLSGSGYMLTADESFTISAVRMVPGTIYNIPRGTWHAHCLNAGSKVLIAENTDTSKTENRLLDEAGKNAVRVAIESLR